MSTEGTYWVDSGHASGPAVGLLRRGAPSVPEERYAATLAWWGTRSDEDLAAMAGHLDEARNLIAVPANPADPTGGV